MDEQSDIALFRLDSHQDLSSYKVSRPLKLEQLTPWNDVKDAPDITDRRAFTIGYNSSHEQDQYPERLRWVTRMLSPQQQADWSAWVCFFATAGWTLRRSWLTAC